MFSEGFQDRRLSRLASLLPLPPATYRARGVDLKVAPDLNVGYVMGTGDDVPQALEQLGIHPHLLSAAEIASADLSRYNVILIGIRAYSNRPELAANSQRLLDYVKTRRKSDRAVPERWLSRVRALSLLTRARGESRRRKRPVMLTDNPLFQWPNSITSADFDGWVEERGHSFLESWDSHYSAPTETHDPGQEPQHGGLIVAPYGKGTYIYVAYALYRQFPEAVPGAYRILANLISAGKTPAQGLGNR